MVEKCRINKNKMIIITLTKAQTYYLTQQLILTMHRHNICQPRYRIRTRRRTLSKN